MMKIFPDESGKKDAVVIGVLIAGFLLLLVVILVGVGHLTDTLQHMKLV